jgi:hypothetical protein
LRSAPSAKGHGEDREGGRRDERRPETLQYPGADQELGGSRYAASSEADENIVSPVSSTRRRPEVGHPAAEQQEPAEHEAVPDDDPLQGALPDAEILLDRGQRDVHDRNIEHDHELRRARQDEDHSLFVCALVPTVDSSYVSMGR